MITIILVGIGGWFGYMIGRRISKGEEEIQVERAAPKPGGGVRLKTITIRR
jgi:hypothetical protein